MAHNTRLIVLRRGDDDGELRLQFAVNPEQLVISRPHNVLQYQTVAGQSVQVPLGSGLMQVTLETFLPGSRSPFFAGVEPREGLALLQRWEQEGTPVRLLISGSELDDLFLICNLRQRLAEGDEDVGIGIDLREYRLLTLSEPESTAEQTAGGLALRTDERELPASYITAGGEDLWSIAREFLGDGSRWKELAARNAISDPHGLPAGKEIWLS